MATTSNPKINIRLISPNVITAFGDRYDLLVGQKIATGTATAGALYEDVQSKTLTEIKTLFGINSELTNRILYHRIANKGVSHLSVIAVEDDVASDKATAYISITGTAATEDKSFKIAIVDKYQYSIALDVLTGTTPAELASAIISAIGELPTIPITAETTAVDGQVLLTATNGGSVGNNYGIEIIGDLPAGLSITSLAGAGFSGGATDPTVTDIFDVVGEQVYQNIGWPESWYNSLSVLETFLTNRINANNNIMDGIGMYGYSGTYATVKALADASNSMVCQPWGNNIVNTAIKNGNAFLFPADYHVAQIIGLDSRRLTSGSDVSDIVISTNGVNDSLGGPHLASKPYFNTPIIASPIAPSHELYTEEEQSELEVSGFSVIGVNRTRNTTILGPSVLPYKYDSAGNEDLTFHYLNYIRTGSVCREILFRLSKERFSQSRLTDEVIVPKYGMETPLSIKAHLLSVMRILMGIALVRGGASNERLISQNTTVEINLVTGTATVKSILPIVTQLRNINYTLQYNFTGETGTQIQF